MSLLFVIYPELFEEIVQNFDTLLVSFLLFVFDSIFELFFAEKLIFLLLPLCNISVFILFVFSFPVVYQEINFLLIDVFLRRLDIFVWSSM